MLILFDAYVHGALDRRGFLDKAKKYAVGGVTAAMLLDALSPKFAEAQQVPEGRRAAQDVVRRIPSPQGSGKAQGLPGAAGRSATGKLPAILVVHENRGLNPHIEDIARRLALDGYMAFAPDALFPAGGYPGDEDKARDAFRPSTSPRPARTSSPPPTGCAPAPDATGKLGAVGFCYGGAHRQHAGDARARAGGRRAVLRRRRRRSPTCRRSRRR